MEEKMNINEMIKNEEVMQIYRRMKDVEETQGMDAFLVSSIVPLADNLAKLQMENKNFSNHTRKRILYTFIYSILSGPNKEMKNILATTTKENKLEREMLIQLKKVFKKEIKNIYVKEKIEREKCRISHFYLCLSCLIIIQQNRIKLYENKIRKCLYGEYQIYMQFPNEHTSEEIGKQLVYLYEYVKNGT